MMSQKLQAAINAQIGKEYFSGYLYQAMAAWFEENSLEGFGKWMRVQAMEEASHAMIFYNFLLDAGGHIDLPAIAKPDNDFTSPVDIFTRGVRHEETVTASIGAIVDIAIEEKHHAAHSFLNWFVDEQVEEEANFNRVLGKLKLIEKGGDGLFTIDAELGARVYALPAPLAGKI